MKIIYKKGDLMQCPEKYILHGCNAQGVMGSGVAKLIRDKYPSAYLAYKASEKYGGMKLGKVTVSPQDDGKVVINGITQEFYDRDGRRYVDYDAVGKVMVFVSWCLYESFKEPENTCVAMPKIGAGLGGGDWDVISEIIELNSLYFQPVVYEL